MGQLTVKFLSSGRLTFHPAFERAKKLLLKFFPFGGRWLTKLHRSLLCFKVKRDPIATHGLHSRITLSCLMG